MRPLHKVFLFLSIFILSSCTARVGAWCPLRNTSVIVSDNALKSKVGSIPNFERKLKNTAKALEKQLKEKGEAQEECSLYEAKYKDKGVIIRIEKVDFSIEPNSSRKSSPANKSLFDWGERPHKKEDKSREKYLTLKELKEYSNFLENKSANKKIFRKDEDKIFRGGALKKNSFPDREGFSGWEKNTSKTERTAWEEFLASKERYNSLKNKSPNKKTSKEDEDKVLRRGTSKESFLSDVYSDLFAYKKESHKADSEWAKDLDEWLHGYHPHEKRFVNIYASIYYSINSGKIIEISRGLSSESYKTRHMSDVNYLYRRAYDIALSDLHLDVMDYIYDLALGPEDIEEYYKSLETVKNKAKCKK